MICQTELLANKSHDLLVISTNTKETQEPDSVLTNHLVRLIRGEQGRR